MIKVKLTDLTIGIKCPAATQDLELNTKNRNNAIQADYIQYGPLNVDEPGDYWEKIADHWDTTEEAAKKSLCGNCTAFDISPRMKECMSGETSDEDGELGYCHMHKFKCHSARSCYTWAKGGPIEDDDISIDWQTKGEEEQLDEKRKKSKKKKGKKDRCYRIAKRKYDVFPSAYASGAIVKCRQGKIWKGLKEDLSNEEEKELKTIKMQLKKSAAKHARQAKQATDIAQASDKSAKLHRQQVDTIEDMLDERKKRKKAGSESGKESSLRDWFKRKGAPGKKGGWVDCNTCRKDKKSGRTKCKPCGRQKGEKRAKYPSCRPTPGACKERGRGKSWGKKSAKGMKEGVNNPEVYNKFMALIKEALGDKVDIIYEQDQPETKTVIKFPKFKINEKNWGKNLNTEDRAVIERIGNQLRGEDPLNRVAFLQQFLTEAEQVSKDITVGEVMGALMFLDIFASVVYEFNASVAGFLFEALFAGIFEGFQIDATEGGGEAGTTDVVLNVKPKGGSGKKGVEYSFKLLSDGKTDIAGSFTDIVDGISKSPDASETYLVVLKSGDKEKITLKFYEFDISKDNWFDWVGAGIASEEKVYEEKEFEFGSEETPKIVMDNLGKDPVAGKIVDGQFVKRPAQRPVAPRREYEALPEEEVTVVTPKAVLKISPYELRNEAGEVPKYLITGRKYKMKVDAGTKRVVKPSSNFKTLYADFLKPGGFVGPNGEDFPTYVGTGAYKKDPEFFDKLKTLSTYGGGAGAGQFVVRQSYMKDHPITDGPEILELDRDRFQQAAAEYTNLIGDQIYDIFTKLSELVDDVSGYFLGVKASTRNAFADRAKTKSKELAEAAEENLVAVEDEDTTDKALTKQKYRRMARQDRQRRSRSGMTFDESKDPTLKENKDIKLVLKKNSELIKETTLKENLQFHLENNIPMDKSVLRFGSASHIKLIAETKRLWEQGMYFATAEEEELFQTDIGEHVLFEGEAVALDVPMLNEEIIEEKKKKKTPQLGKPTRNTKGKKKYKVFVRNPKTGNIMKITFGDKKGGLEGNWNDPEARKSFAKRHKCAQKNDRTKAGYWACRAHKFFGKNVPGRFW